MEKKRNEDLLSVMGSLGKEILDNNNESKISLDILILKQKESIEFAFLKDAEKSQSAIRLYFNGCDEAEKESDRDKIMAILVGLSVKLEELYKSSEYKDNDLSLLNKRIFIRAYWIDQILKIEEPNITDDEVVLIEEEIDFFNRMAKLDSRLNEAKSIYLEYQLATRAARDLLSLTSFYYLALDKLNLLVDEIKGDEFDEYYRTLDLLMNLRFNEAIEILNLGGGNSVFKDDIN